MECWAATRNIRPETISSIPPARLGRTPLKNMATPIDPWYTPALRIAMPIKTAREAIDQPATSAARAIVLEEYK
ncbi:MAG: hypothetical protein MK138_10985 [Planctomycetes bacterium]|nr:hypothetical protein [Planctomycetota bacterium]